MWSQYKPKEQWLLDVILAQGIEHNVDATKGVFHQALTTAVAHIFLTESPVRRSIPLLCRHYEYKTTASGDVHAVNPEARNLVPSFELVSVLTIHPWRECFLAGQSNFLFRCDLEVVRQLAETLLATATYWPSEIKALSVNWSKSKCWTIPSINTNFHVVILANGGQLVGLQTNKYFCKALLLEKQLTALSVKLLCFF